MIEKVAILQDPRILYFDSHCHLQDERILADLDSIVSRASSEGVQWMVCCGSEESDWQRVSEIYQKYPGMIIPAFGIHPFYIQSRSAAWLNKLEELLIMIPNAAVGEIGLDFFIEQPNKSEQISVFIEQIRLAHKYHRPVSVHCRKAWEELLFLIKQEHGICYGGVLHSYSGSAELVESFVKLGFSIAFSGSITNPHNRKVKKAAQTVPKEQLLIETDSPDISPYGYQQYNEPSNIKIIATELAAIRNIHLKEVADLTLQNGLQIFRKTTDTNG